MTGMNYEAVGKFIYGAHRYGAGPNDMENWMADDMGIPRPAAGDQQAAGEVIAAFFAKYQDRQELLDENYARFIGALKSRIL